MSRDVYIGNLDTRVDFFHIVNPTVTTTGMLSGGEILFKKVWAKIEHSSSTEVIDGQPTLVNVKKITTRYYNELFSKGLFLKINNEPYEIVGVETIDRKRYITFTVTNRE